MWVKRVRIGRPPADDLHVITQLWHRTTAAVHSRYRASAPALYGAGLHIDRDDCGFGLAEVPVPAPRRPVAPAGERGPREAVAAPR